MGAALLGKSRPSCFAGTRPVRVSACPWARSSPTAIVVFPLRGFYITQRSHPFSRKSPLDTESQRSESFAQ